MDFADKLRFAMQKKGISQSELSSITGISKSGISQYLSGKNLPKDILIEKLESALDCKLTISNAKIEIQTEKAIQFSTKKITIRKAATVMHISEDTLSEKLKNGEFPFGFANKTEGSSKHSYYISPKKFYEYTGWCY